MGRITFMSEYDYDKKDILFATIEEPGVSLFTVTDGVLDIIQCHWSMWDAIVVHVAKQRADMEAEIKALPGNAESSLKKPLFSEINFKDFPGSK